VGSFVLKLVILPKLKLEVLFDNITCEDGVLHCITIYFVLRWFKHRLGKTGKSPFIWSLHIDTVSDETVDRIPFHLHDFHESTQKEGMYRNWATSLFCCRIFTFLL